MTLRGPLWIERQTFRLVLFLIKATNKYVFCIYFFKNQQFYCCQQACYLMRQTVSENWNLTLFQLNEAFCTYWAPSGVSCLHFLSSLFFLSIFVFLNLLYSRDNRTVASTESPSGIFQPSVVHSYFTQKPFFHHHV